MSQTKSQDEIEFRQFSENFTFYVVEYASQIESMFNSIILVDLVRDHKQYKDYLEYFQKKTFESKKQLVKIILQSYYPQTLENYSGIFSEIGDVQEWRNKLAHNTKHYLSHEDGTFTYVLANPIIDKKICLSKSYMQEMLPKFEKTVQKFFEIDNLVAKDRRYDLDALLKNSTKSGNDNAE